MAPDERAAPAPDARMGGPGGGRFDWGALDDAFRGVIGPALAALLLAALLALADPAHEILLLYAADIVTVWRGEPALSLVDSLFLVSRVLVTAVALYMAGELLWSTAWRTAVDRRRLGLQHGSEALEAWLPRLIGALPHVGAASGLVAAAFSDKADGDQQLVLLIFAQLAVALGAFAMSRQIARRRSDGDRRRLFRRRFLPLVGTAAAVTAIVAFADPDHRAGRSFGVLLLGLFACGMLYLDVIGLPVRARAKALLRDAAASARAEAAGARAEMAGAAGGGGEGFWRAAAAAVARLLRLLALVAYRGVFVLMLAAGLFALAAPDRAGGLAAPAGPPLIGAFFLALIAAGARRRGDLPDKEPDALLEKEGRSWRGRVYAWSFVATVAVTLLLLAAGEWVAPALGPIAMTCLFVGLFATNTTRLAEFARRRLGGLPVTALIVAFAVVLATVGLTDNTRARVAPTLSAWPDAAPEGPEIGATFAAWAEELDPGAPVYVVAAEGGGLFAAYHVAYGLAAIVDQWPEVGGRIFAVSGVSGGSVGAGFFAAVQASGVCGDAAAGSTCRRDLVRRMLRRDFLSPVLGGLLFYDFAAGFVPGLAEIPRTDRARALERAFERAAGELGEAGEAFLDRSVLDAPREGDGAWPALLLNATNVDTGERVVLAPFAFDPDYSPEADRGQPRYMRDLSAGDAPPIVTAMGLSARFPVVTPPGRLDVRSYRGAPGSIRLVDGGYFDNSGLETAHEIVERVSRGMSRGRLHPVVLLAFRAQGRAPCADGPPTAPCPVAPTGEATAPLTAFVSAWRGRGDLTKARAVERAPERRPCAVLPAARGGVDDPLTVASFFLDEAKYSFTLSWMLATRTFEAIERSVESQLGLDGTSCGG